MNNEYIKDRKTSLQAEFDANTKTMGELQEKQLRLQGAFAELTAAEGLVELPEVLEPKKSKESK